jgi:hypothetical protein
LTITHPSSRPADIIRGSIDLFDRPGTVDDEVTIIGGAGVIHAGSALFGGRGICPSPRSSLIGAGMCGGRVRLLEPRMHADKRG